MTTETKTTITCNHCKLEITGKHISVTFCNKHGSSIEFDGYYCDGSSFGPKSSYDFCNFTCLSEWANKQEERAKRKGTYALYSDENGEIKEVKICDS